MKRVRLSALLVPVVLVVLTAPAAQSQIFYVAAGAPGGTGACDMPFGTIAEALAAAQPLGMPTEIRIAGGPGGLVYPESDLVVDFSDVSLKGGYDAASFVTCDDVAIEAARDVNGLPTVIDGSMAPTPDRIMSVLPQTDGMGDFMATNTGIVIDGIVFRNGKPMEDGAGGALLILNCGLRVTQCAFDSNSSTGHFFGGGAVYFLGYFTTSTMTFNEATLELTDSVFVNNQTDDGVNGSGLGGALFAGDFNVDGNAGVVQRMTTVNASGNQFIMNTSRGGGVIDPMICMDLFGGPNADCSPADGTDDICTSAALGGAVYLQNIDGIWDLNTFDQNTALGRAISQADFTGQGGGLTAVASASPFQANPTLTNNTFTNNVADAGAGATMAVQCGYFNAWGGAAYLVGFDEEFRGNTLRGNRATGTGNTSLFNAFGGGLFVSPQSLPVIAENNFSMNVADGGGTASAWGGGAFVLGGQAVITQNAFNSNEANGPLTTAYGVAYGGGLNAYAMDAAFPQVTANSFTGNIVRGQSSRLTGVGGAAFIETPSPNALVADNVATANQATEIVAGLQFSGFVLRSDTGTGAAASSQPRLQNNLIHTNVGIGLFLWGQGSEDAGTARAPMTVTMLNNTVTGNTAGGVFMNSADNAVLDSNIVWGNGGFGSFADGLFNTSDDTVLIQLIRNDIGFEPMGPPDLVSSLNDMQNANFVGVDPQFASGPGGDFYLDQASPLVDHGWEPALLRGFGPPRPVDEYDLDGDTVADRMSHRTTNGATESPDICFVDVGYHYRVGVAAIDTDLDGVPDADEAAFGTDPLDADTDNDGIVDGLDCGGDIDGDGTSAALDCDSDGDGVPDGTEAGLTMPVPDDPGGAFMGTDTADTCDTSNAPCGRMDQSTWVPDADAGATTTDRLEADSDGNGEVDGCEDTNQDGACMPCGQPCFDDGMGNPVEQDPTVPGDDDADGDCITTDFETFLSTNALDIDTDDDGISDGVEAGFDPRVPATNTEATVCDTDGDLLPDGLEVGVTTPIPDDPAAGILGTDTGASCDMQAFPAFIADTDPGSVTDPTNENTDGDGCLDGEEDLNQNGAADGGEMDPTVVDCTPPGRPFQSNNVVMALHGGTRGGGEGLCAPLTDPPASPNVTLTACDAGLSSCQPNLRLDPVRTAGTELPPGAVVPLDGSALVLAGEAVASYEPGVLVFYEFDGCNETLEVRKDGVNIEIRAVP